MSFRRNIDGRKTSLRFEGKSKTEAHHMRDCDINRLFNRLVGGDISVIKRGAVYADISEMPNTLQAVMNKQIDCRRAYEALPDNVRARYKTAEEFYRAVNDENSRSTFKELGLIVEPKPIEPVKVEVINSQVADPNAPSA